MKMLLLDKGEALCGELGGVLLPNGCYIVAECNVAKNRHGGTGEVDVGWIGKFTKFRNLAEGEDAPN